MANRSPTRTSAGKEYQSPRDGPSQRRERRGFKLGAYDVRKPLVIDPLVYGSYFGGEQGPDEVRAAVPDVSATGVDRGLIVVGSSASPDFPATSFPFTDTLNPAGVDAFIARIDPSGAQSDFSVLFGGLGDDVAQYLKVDPVSRDLWIAGTTIFNNTTNSFPATNVNPNPTGTTHFEIPREPSPPERPTSSSRASPT